MRAGKPDTIVTSDGTTLLGADDKAGIAGIATLAEYLIGHPEIAHGPIEILFSPDEETGHGMDRVPLASLAASAFYTVDGGAVGELESECFNAWKADIAFTGVSAHLGAARGKMVNAVAMAASFIESLPAQESPEATDGHFGYFCPLEVSGSCEKASLTVYLRDFDRENMARRLERLEGIAAGVRARFPGGRVEVKKTEQYRNMKEKLDAAPEVLELLKKAAARAGVEPRMKPIRGGTDGSRLTELGIPTPNLFTGGHNYHSRTEWASLAEMTAMVHTLIELAKLWGE
jgi:tripeptide aminopeptidase